LLSIVEPAAFQDESISAASAKSIFLVCQPTQLNNQSINQSINQSSCLINQAICFFSPDCAGPLAEQVVNGGA
jgi:hypothetical protein